MTISISFLLCVLVICIVAYPFLKRQNIDRKGLHLGTIMHALRIERESLYEEIRSAQIEHNIGLVTKDQYDDRLHDLHLRAIESFRKQENIERSINKALEDIFMPERSEDVPYTS